MHSTVTSGHHNLPAVPSSLVGRDRDVAAVADLLAACRLVTVTGPAGVGKTRLAVEVATRVAGGHRDGAWLVELAGLREPAAVPAAIAAVLSLREEAGPASTDTLTAALRDREVLLVLDNCEHVAEACAALTDRLLATCCRLSILATSQRPLGAAHERTWQVEPLALPPPEADSDPGRLAGYPAVHLFVDRAVGHQAGFALTAEVAPAVAEIARRLDGVPLAIELAASWVAILPPAEIARRLNDRFRLLTRGARSAPARHQALRAALDWSHGLLPPPERVLFRRLGVFAGGFTPQAAAVVCAGADLARERVPDLLASLVSRCLVVDDTFPGRLRLLDTARAYAHDRLDEAGEADALRAAHAAWCLDLAERAAPQLAAGDQQAWLARLDAERANLHAALAHATGDGHDEAGMRLAAALVLYWSMRGRFHEGLRWLGAAAAGAGPPGRRAAVLWGAGLLARLVGDYAGAATHAQEALMLARQAGDTRLCARALGVLGAAGVSARDDLRRAIGNLEESVRLAREAEDSWCEVGSLFPLGLSYLLSGRPPAARRSFEECLAVAERRSGAAAHAHRLHALLGLGRARLVVGDHREATLLLDEALTLSRTFGIPSATVTALRFLGEAALMRGDHGSAEATLTECVELSDSLGAAALSAPALLSLGRVALARGDAAGARRVLSRARSLAAGGAEELPVPGILVGLGATARLAGDLAAADRELTEALAAARRADDAGAIAAALHELGLVARACGDPERAEVRHEEALRWYRQQEDRSGTATGLEALAGLAAAGGRTRAAARLFGAAQAIRDSGGLPRQPADAPSYHADVSAVRQALDAQAFRAAWAEGSRLSPQEAAASAARDARERPMRGWYSLTERERDVVRLAARRLTNREIASRLAISPRTVQTHLTNAFTKLEVSSRRQLADVVPHDPTDG